jgi:hypothetical protein
MNGSSDHGSIRIACGSGKEGCVSSGLEPGTNGLSVDLV